MDKEQIILPNGCIKDKPKFTFIGEGLKGYYKGEDGLWRDSETGEIIFDQSFFVIDKGEHEIIR